MTPMGEHRRRSAPIVGLSPITIAEVHVKGGEVFGGTAGYGGLVCPGRDGGVLWIDTFLFTDEYRESDYALLVLLAIALVVGLMPVWLAYLLPQNGSSN